MPQTRQYPAFDDLDARFDFSFIARFVRARG